MRRECREAGRGEVSYRIVFAAPCLLSPTGEHEVEVAYALDDSLIGVRCECDGRRDAADVALALRRSVGDHETATCWSVRCGIEAHPRTNEVPEHVPRAVLRYKRRGAATDAAPDVRKELREELALRAISKIIGRDVGRRSDYGYEFSATVTRGLCTFMLQMPDELNRGIRIGSRATYRGRGVWELTCPAEQWPEVKSDSRCDICGRSDLSRKSAENHRRTVRHRKNKIRAVAQILARVSNILYKPTESAERCP